MKILMSLLLLIPVLSFAQFSFKANLDQDLDIQEFLEKSRELLPSSIRAVLNKEIKVEFKRLENSKGNLTWAQVVGNRFFGKKRWDTIELNLELIDYIKNGKGRNTALENRLEEELIHNHKDDYQFALATLIHEVAHLYDFQGGFAPVEADVFSECPDAPIHDSICHNLQHQKRRVSDSPFFLRLTDWKPTGIIRRGYKSRNKINTRVIDVYERSHPQESFGVNFEYFILDPEYKCRRPGLYNYLAESLMYWPHSNFQCRTNFKAPKQGAIAGEELSFFDLDPSRLYQVHYLFAGKGKNMMSRWGHSMLRLVMCAPERERPSEECLKDRSHDVVVSFRADITNFKISTWKGLTGKYPSKLFLLPLSEVIEEYTQGELRDVYSIPLRMDEEQKLAFVQETLDRFWNYEGKYYFTVNNCADETLNLLRRAFSNYTELLDIRITTPLGLDKQLKRLGIADVSAFEDLESAKRKGLFFEGPIKRLREIFQELKSFGATPIGINKVEDLIDHTSADERAAMAELVSWSKPLIGKLIFLEESVLKKKEKELNKKIGEKFFELKEQNGSSELVEAYERLNLLMREADGVDLSSGYGIPQLEDGIFVKSEASAEVLDEAAQIQVYLFEELAEIFKEEFEEIVAIREHKRFLLQTFLNINP